MKRIKSFKIFENFDLGREEIIDFFEDFDLVDVISIEMTSVSDFNKYYKEKIKYDSYYFTNLFSPTKPVERDFTYQNEQVMVVTLDFYHPKMIRNSSFQYENYIRETLKGRLQRVQDGYDMDVFMCLEGGVNYLTNPIAKVQLFIFEKD